MKIILSFNVISVIALVKRSHYADKSLIDIEGQDELEEIRIVIKNSLNRFQSEKTSNLTKLK